MNRRYKLTHPLDTLHDYYLNAKAFWQRGKRGYADLDAWNIDTYLCDIIPAMLRQKIEHGVGYPGDPNDPNCDTEEHWNDTLRAMVGGFEAKRYMFEHLHSPNTKQNMEWIVGSRLFIKYFDCLWD